MARDVKFSCDCCGKPLINYNSRNAIVVDFGPAEGKQSAKAQEEEAKVVGRDNRRILDLCTYCVNSSLRELISKLSRQERVEFLLFVNRNKTENEKNPEQAATA